MDKCTAVAKKELLYAGPFGLASYLCGLIFIDRVHSHSARNSVNTATEIVKEKKVLISRLYGNQKKFRGVLELLKFRAAI